MIWIGGTATRKNERGCSGMIFFNWFESSRIEDWPVGQPLVKNVFCYDHLMMKLTNSIFSSTKDYYFLTEFIGSNQTSLQKIYSRQLYF